MRVLVTGGAGYIGSVVAEKLLDAGHETFVYDNLSKGFRAAVPPPARLYVGDLLDGAALAACLKETKAEAVIHMAAASLVGESAQKPAFYYRQNVVGGLNLLEQMREHGVGRLVFSSTAAVYGEPETQPITEDFPLRPTNPYGASKLAFEQALPWHAQAYGLKYASLRYFNAAGATARAGECHHPETHLIPLVLQAAAGQRPSIQVFGDDYPTRDGTCLRDYVHVEDLAQAHILALAREGENSIFNLGCGGEGYTVREVIETARAVTGREIKVETAPRRAGDPAQLVASSELIRRQLGWQPRFQDLREIIESAWLWMQNYPNGYKTLM